MAMFFAFVAFCLSGGAFAQIITSGPCPEVKLQENLVSAKILGKWYEQASFYALYENGAECGIFNYFIDAKNNIPIENYTFTSSVTGKEGFYVTELLTPDPEEPGRLLRKHPLSPIEGYSNVLILGTDYDNWLAGYGCNEVCNMNLQYAWIVTKAQVPDESDLASAYAVMQQNNIDTSLLMKMEQKKCRK